MNELLCPKCGAPKGVYYRIEKVQNGYVEACLRCGNRVYHDVGVHPYSDTNAWHRGIPVGKQKISEHYDDTVCPVCGESFQKTRYRTHTCSIECGLQPYRELGMEAA